MTDAPQRVVFHKVLVANRGEIARRILRTLRNMGLASVAVYSDADATARHVEMADEAVRIGPADSAKSYLDMDALLDAAQRVGAEAIHPGYGFLAERADFAVRCAERGIVFIGPSPEAIRTMGDKRRAKDLAVEVGVPVVPGCNVDGLDSSSLQTKATDIGYPLLVKAAAGGGGKGMRVVAAASDLEEALQAARREAQHAFGDGALLLERYVDSPRHVEVQLIADAYGHTLHLFERDCSLQRRHQKVFEECPSPAVDGDLRRRLGDAAVALAKAVDYRGAGTVEFLLEPDGTFYFLEMNTRLQVEHPVTEMVTGLDLVRLQLDVAAGFPLQLAQGDVRLSGHAIEARLYAEDPDNDFLPAAGTVTLCGAPEVPGVRIDWGVAAHDTVGIHYDPLLAKVIAHGRDRDEAVQRLRRGLAELAVGGPVTNREFLLTVLEHGAFRRGEVTTTFVADHMPPGRRQRPPNAEILRWHGAAAALFLVEQRRREQSGPTPSGLPGGWRNNRWRPQEHAFEHALGPLTVGYVELADGRFDVTVSTPLDDPAVEAAALRAHLVACDTRRIVLVIDGLRRTLRVACRYDAAGTLCRLSVHGVERLSELTPTPRFPPRRAAKVAGGNAAPMTGRVLEVRVQEGDSVRSGDVLLILEAMKMEHPVVAREDGTVGSVRVAVGDMVDPDQILVVVDAAPASDKDAAVAQSAAEETANTEADTP